jgi:hypothetical protein
MIALDKFSGIYSQYVDDVFRVALTDVNHRDIAETITAEAFLALFQGSEKITLDRYGVRQLHDMFSSSNDFAARELPVDA